MGFFDKLLGTENNKINVNKLKSRREYLSSIVSFLENKIRRDGIDSLINNDVYITLNIRYNITMSSGGAYLSLGDTFGHVMINDLKAFKDYVNLFPKIMPLEDKQKATEIHLMLVDMYLGANLDLLGMSIYGALCQKVPELRNAPNV